MSIVIDIIVLLILVGSVYRGYKKGIVDIGFKLVAFIVALLISIILYSPITNIIIENTDIDEKIEKIIIENGNTKDSNESPEENNTEVDDSGIDTYIKNYSQNIAQNAKSSLVETAAKPIAKNVIGIGVLILLFLSTRIVLTIIKTFTDIITKLPVIKQFNEITGLIYGMLIGLVIIYALLAICFFIVSVSGNTTISTEIGATYITKYFYNNNLILKLLF